MKYFDVTEKGARVAVDSIKLIVSKHNIISETPMVIIGTGVCQIEDKGRKTKTSLMTNSRYICQPSSVHELRNVSKSNNDNVKLDDYKLLVFNKGDFFVFYEKPVSTNGTDLPFVADIDNIAYVFNSILNGKANTYVPYDKQLTMLTNSVDNNEPLPVSLLVYEAFLCKTFVSISDVTKDYRLVKDGKYIPISLKEKAYNTDAFSGVTSQDAKTSLIMACNMSKKKVTTEAPSEKYSLL